MTDYKKTVCSGKNTLLLKEKSERQSRRYWMGKKYFSWSFDDGLVQDRKIVEILSRYGMRATFHLNAGLFGDRNMIGRIGNYGISCVSYEKYDPQKRYFLKYCESFRLEKEEAVELYKGHEIAAHGFLHRGVKNLAEEELRQEIMQDIDCLSKLFHTEIKGFAYPGGGVSEPAKKILQEAGILYARTVGGRDSFLYPEQPLLLGLNCWHIYKDTFQRLAHFYETESEQDQFFLMFAHGYEFDFGTKESSWDKFEKICESVASQKDICCIPICEALEHMKARKE